MLSGEKATYMGILMSGTLSSWTPMSNSAMQKPLFRLREHLIQAIKTQAAELVGFEFKFHLDPFEI